MKGEYKERNRRGISSFSSSLMMDSVLCAVGVGSYLTATTKKYIPERSLYTVPDLFFASFFSSVDGFKSSSFSSLPLTSPQLILNIVQTLRGLISADELQPLAA